MQQLRDIYYKLIVHIELVTHTYSSLNKVFSYSAQIIRPIGPMYTKLAIFY
jgi:hypothetical protein